MKKILTLMLLLSMITITKAQEQEQRVEIFASVTNIEVKSLSLYRVALTEGGDYVYVVKKYDEETMTLLSKETKKLEVIETYTTITISNEFKYSIRCVIEIYGIVR